MLWNEWRVFHCVFLPRLGVVGVTWVWGETQRWQQLRGCGEPCCREHGSAALLLLFIPHKEETKWVVDVWERQRAGEEAIKCLSGTQAGAAGREAVGDGGLAPIPAFRPAPSCVEEHVWLQKYRYFSILEVSLLIHFSSLAFHLHQEAV